MMQLGKAAGFKNYGNFHVFFFNNESNNEQDGFSLGAVITYTLNQVSADVQVQSSHHIQIQSTLTFSVQV